VSLQKVSQNYTKPSRPNYHILKTSRKKYSVIQKDGLNFVRLYFPSYTWYVNDLHNI